MNKKFIVIIVLAVCFFNSVAQTNTLAQDTAKIHSLFSLIENEPEIDIWKKYNEDMLLLTEYHLRQNHEPKQFFLKYKAHGLSNRAYVFDLIGNIGDATKLYRQAIDTFNVIGEKTDMAINMDYLGMIVFNQGDTKQALKLIQDAFKIQQQAGDEKGASISMQHLANVHNRLHDYKTAIAYYEKCMALYLKLHDRENEASALNNIANIYQVNDDHEKALNYYYKCLSLAKGSNDRKTISTVLNNIGNSFFKLKNYPIALQYYDSAYKNAEVMNDKRSLAFTFLKIGKVYSVKGNLTETEKYYLQSLKLSRELGYPIYLRNASEALYELYEKQNKKDKAYEMFKLFVKMRDSVSNTEVKNAALKSQYQHEYDIKEIQLRQEQEKKDFVKQKELEAEQRKKNELLWIAAGICVITVILGVLTFVSYRLFKNQKKISAELERKNIEIKEQGEKLLKQEVMLSRYQSQMNPHFIFNAVNGIQGLILNNDNKKAFQQIQLFSKLLRETLNNSSEEFIPLDKELNYLKDYVTFELNRFTNKFEYHVKLINIELPSEICIPPMLIQPLLENSIKHAGLNDIINGAIELIITADTEKRCLNISLSDNGRGCSPEALEKSSSKGLKITRERIKSLLLKYKATNSLFFEINNVLPKGTKTSLTLPLIYNDELRNS